MKGVSLISDIFLLLALIGVTIVMTLFLWYLIMIYEFIVTPVGLSTPREVTLRLLSDPVEYDSTMLSFLETSYKGIPMKRIMNAVAIQGTVDVWLDGKSISADLATDQLLTPMINKNYILKISPQEIFIINYGIPQKENIPTGVQKVTTPLFLLDGKAVEMQLFVSD